MFRFLAATLQRSLVEL
uniref:Uncharacterized protein n=1 Tax=Anguilla anguilla TaxID=7936 RepID=A0A0E9P5Q7_ANGAN